MRNFIYAIGVCSLLFSCNSELETLPEEFNTEGKPPFLLDVWLFLNMVCWGGDMMLPAII